MLHAHSQPSRCSVCSCTCARHFRRGLRPLPVLSFRLVGNVVSASSSGQSRRPQSAEVLSLSAQKIPIPKRDEDLNSHKNHPFGVHCCAVYTLPGNGGLPVPTIGFVPLPYGRGAHCRSPARLRRDLRLHFTAPGSHHSPTRFGLPIQGTVSVNVSFCM